GAKRMPPVAADQPPGPAHGLGPPAALDDQRLDAHAEPDPDVDPGDDEQDQPADDGQPHQDADQQHRPQPVEAEAVALLHAGVLTGHLGGHGSGDRPGEDQVRQDAGERGHQARDPHRPPGGLHDDPVAGGLALGADQVAEQVLDQGDGNDHHAGDSQQGAPVPSVELKGGAQDLADAHRTRQALFTWLSDDLANVRTS